MSLLYDVLRCLSNCFKCLRIFYIVLHLTYHISVFFEIFKKKIFNFVLKIIYLSIHFSHVRLDVTLDYDIINTILLLLFFFKKKKFSTFPLWNCTPGFFKRKKSYNFLFFPLFFLFWIVVFFSFINFFFRYISWCFWLYGRKNWVWKILFKIKRIISKLYIPFNDIQNIINKLY